MHNTHTYIPLYTCIKLCIFQSTQRWSYPELHNHSIERLKDLPRFALSKWEGQCRSEVSWFLARSSFHHNSCHRLLGRPGEDADLASLKLTIIDGDGKISSAVIFQVGWSKTVLCMIEVSCWVAIDDNFDVFCLYDVICHHHLVL